MNVLFPYVAMSGDRIPRLIWRPDAVSFSVKEGKRCCEINERKA